MYTSTNRMTLLEDLLEELKDFLKALANLLAPLEAPREPLEDLLEPFSHSRTSRPSGIRSLTTTNGENLLKPN